MAEKESVGKALKFRMEAVKAAEETQAVPTQTSTDATAALAKMTDERDTSRDSADYNTPMRQNVVNYLTAARTISTQLRADLAAKEEKLTAARSSTSTNIFTL